MENYRDIVNKINMIIEQSNCDSPKCKNCVNHCDGACTFGCVNERSVGKYLFSQRKLTSPDYSCDNFKPVIIYAYQRAFRKAILTMNYRIKQRFTDSFHLLGIGQRKKLFRMDGY